jgi:hypothetical protein
MSPFARYLVLPAALLFALSSAAHAAGSYRKQAMFPDLVIAGVPTPKLSVPALPQVNPAQLLGGCGRGRVRDLQTNLCHGPGDIGR